MAQYGGGHIEVDCLVKESAVKFNRETSLRLSAHAGTHLDFPSHFYRDGKKGDDYPLEAFFFERVALVECDCLESEAAVDSSVVAGLTDPSIELLLIKTHYCTLRDDERYWSDSPVVRGDLASSLRSLFPKLRAVGFDLISVTSRRDKDEGRRAHLDFLDGAGGREILLIEDMNLNAVSRSTHFQRVMAVPVFFKDMEGSPCTVLAEVLDGVSSSVKKRPR